MSSVSSDYESSYYTESEAESDYVTHEDGQQTHYNHTREVEDIIREHVNVTTQNAVGLNHHYRAKLLELRTQLEGLLSRCRNRLGELEKSIEDFRLNLTPKPRPVRPRHAGYICGQPFFKDHELYPGPHNEDYLYRKNVKREFFPLDLFETTETLWTRKDKQTLKSSIETQALEFLQREYGLRERRCDNAESAERIRNERRELDTLPIEKIWPKALAYDGKYGRQQFAVDWLKLSTSIMGGRHSAAACEGMWNNYLMPGLKRSNWTQEEESELVKAAEAHKCHRWDMIAQRVNERSEYQCFVHYQTNFSELVQSKKRPWTKEEDELLIRSVEETRIGNHVIWNKVVERMPYRNKVQVYHRYKYTLQRPLRRAKFTEEEDCVITAYVLQYGDDFKFFPDELLPGRTIKQIWARYMNTLRFVNQYIGWNLAEDKRLMTYIAEHLTEEGPQKISWAHCSKTLGNHSRLSCRSRYYTIERFLEKNPNATLEDVPRRDKKKLSTNVTDKNWVQTIVDIKSAPKDVAQKAGGGPINLFQSGKPSTAEWSLYEQMKFCFRFKFDNRLTEDALPSYRVSTGTKMLLHLLEGFQGCRALQASSYPLSEKDKPLLENILRAPLDWPNVVSIMQPKITVSGEAMLFCRIPPNYNTVLGLRGVCLNACSEPAKQILPELRVKKLETFNQPLYDQAMALLVERFRKIFHWTMLLMMLNIDDVTLENDEPVGNDLGACSSNRPELQLKPIENLICPVKMDKLMDVRSCAGSYPEQADPCASLTPVVKENNETNLKLVTNITIIDPKDLPLVPVYEYGGEKISNQQDFVDQFQHRFEPSENSVQKLKETSATAATQKPFRVKRSRPRKSTNRPAQRVDENVQAHPQGELAPHVILNQYLENPFDASGTGHLPSVVSKKGTKRQPRSKASNSRKNNNKEAPPVDEQYKTCTEQTVVPLLQSKLEAGVNLYQHTLTGQYQQYLDDSCEFSKSGNEPTTVCKRPTKTKTRSNIKPSKPRINTKKAAHRVDGPYENSNTQVAATGDPSSRDNNHCEIQNVTTFTIMEVPQDLYLKKQMQQNLNYVDGTHLSCSPEISARSDSGLHGVITNDNMSTNCSNAFEAITSVTAEQPSTEFYQHTDVVVLKNNVSQPRSSIHDTLEVLPKPLASINTDSFCSRVTEDLAQPTAPASGDMVVVDKIHDPADVGAMAMECNTRDQRRELERLIVTEREIQMPSGQIAFEGSYIEYCIDDDHNPDMVDQEMIAIHSVNEPPPHNPYSVASESVCWHQTVDGPEDAVTVAKMGDEPYGQQLPNGSIASPKREPMTDSKSFLNLELLGDMDGEHVTAVDIIRMLSKRRDSEESDEETEIEDTTND